MHVDLIFIDTRMETKRGFVRGLVLLLLLYLALAPYFFVFERQRKAFFAWMLVLVLVSSALSVAHPSTALSAAAYGALVGILVFASAFLLLSTHEKHRKASWILSTFYWTGVCVLGSIFLFMGWPAPIGAALLTTDSQ